MQEKPEETLAALLQGVAGSNRKHATVRRDDLRHALGKGVADKLMEEKGSGTSVEWVKFSRKELAAALVEAGEKVSTTPPTKPAA